MQHTDLFIFFTSPEPSAQRKSVRFVSRCCHSLPSLSDKHMKWKKTSPFKADDRYHYGEYNKMLSSKKPKSHLFAPPMIQIFDQLKAAACNKMNNNMQDTFSFVNILHTCLSRSTYESFPPVTGVSLLISCKDTKIDCLKQGSKAHTHSTTDVEV